jgi:hypothetical protein
MGRPLPGIDGWVDGRRARARPATAPTFFRGYIGDRGAERPVAHRRPVTQDDDGSSSSRGATTT